MKDENSLSPAQSPAPLPLVSLSLLPSRSPTMRELESAITDIARSDLPVLLIGEKGTGKEVIARQIHHHYSGGETPFVTIRCSERDPRFLRELFQETARAARVREGRRATVFLDEVGALNLSCQSALVEATADGDGKALAQRSGARLISANSHSLEEEIRKERFREDLFYRLNGICLLVPPLRHRKEDIPGLMELFLKLHAETLGCPPAVLQAKTMQALLQHSWPGNVRELEEVAKKILLSDEHTTVAGLKSTVSGSPTRERFSAVLSLKEAARNASRQVERELILKTLERTRWNRKRAARELGISYKALLYKLKQIALDDPAGI
jgi:two-component system, NtrC family, response regulator AtoC